MEWDSITQLAKQDIRKLVQSYADDGVIVKWDVPIREMEMKRPYEPRLNVYSYLVSKIKERYPEASFVYDIVYLELEIAKKAVLADRKYREENHIDYVWDSIFRPDKWLRYQSHRLNWGKQIREEVEKNRIEITKNALRKGRYYD